VIVGKSESAGAALTRAFIGKGAFLNLSRIPTLNAAVLLAGFALIAASSADACLICIVGSMVIAI